MQNTLVASNVAWNHARLQRYSTTRIPDLGTVWKGVVSFMLYLQGNSGFETGLNPVVSINNKLTRNTELNKFHV